MKKALLIGFGYDPGVKFVPEYKVCALNHAYHRELRGAIIDIYLAYRYFASRGYHIEILCDFTEEPSSISSSVLSGYVDVEILNFLEERSHLITRIRNKGDLEMELMGRCHGLEKSEVEVVYFSGHGESGGPKDNFILPDGEGVAWLEFYEYVKKCRGGDRVYIILDCCYPSNLDLRYTFRDGEFAENIIYRACEHLGKITLITSSGTDESAISSDRGSLFTKYLLEFLEEEVKTGTTADFTKLKEFIESKIHGRCGRSRVVSIYSSDKDVCLLL